LDALRELAFIKENDNEIKIDNSKITISLLNEFKGIVFGGTDKWQDKLKQTLLNTTFVSYDALNFNDDIIKKCDRIFINTGYISHAMYYKILAGAKKHNKPITLMNFNNDKLVLNIIYNAIKGM
jgi:hypothetical protein